MAEQQPQDDSIVKKGGIADDAEAEDVTRDTYGFGEAPEQEHEGSREDVQRRLDEILPDDEVAG